MNKGKNGAGRKTQSKPAGLKAVAGAEQVVLGNKNAQLKGDGSAIAYVSINSQPASNNVTPASVYLEELSGRKLGWKARDEKLLDFYFKLCQKSDSFFGRLVKHDEEAIQEFLVSSGLAFIDEDQQTLLTRAGVLFCCKRELIPRDILHVGVRFIQRTEEEELRNNVFGSVLFLYRWSIRKLTPFFQNSMGSPDSRDDYGSEHIFYEYPRVSLIEGLVNFLIHRDYSLDDAGRIIIYPDRIEFSNPGQSVIPPKDLLEVEKPFRPGFRRNPRLIETMSLALINQQEGTGVLRIRRELQKNKSLRPDGKVGMDCENDQENNRFNLIIYKRIPLGSAGSLITGNFLSSTISKRISTVPPMPSLMIGRDNDINALKERFSIRGVDKRSLQVLTAMKGWPGVGKTTVASALAHDPDIANYFPDGVLWTTLGQKPNIISEMATWGRALGTDELLKVQSVEEAQSILAGLLRDKRMLLIIDDVWEASDAVPFKVGGPNCATLVTTRLDSVASALAPVAEDVYRLKILQDEDAIELLRALAPSVVKQYPDECLVLAQELEGLPLALQVAGHLLNAETSYGFGVKELIEELREGAQLLEATAPADRTDLVTETTPTVAALLQKSLDRLDNDIKEYYAYLGVFAPKPATFDVNAMKYVWQIDDPKPVIKTLVDRGLLEFVPELGRYQMHPLLVMLAKSLLVD